VIIMSEQRQTKARREISAIDDKKLRLYARQPLRDGGWKPELRVLPKENNPCIEVSLGYKNDRGYLQKIELPMAPVPFETLLQLIERVAKHSQACSFEFGVRGRPWIWNREQGKNIRSPEVMDIGKIEVGKREDGSVYLLVGGRGSKDLVEFDFKADEYHPITQNGVPVAVGIDSSTAACAWVKVIRDVYSAYFNHKWEEPAYEREKRLERARNAQQGGQRQGNYNQGSNNSQSRPAPAPNPMDEFDDDIPF